MLVASNACGTDTVRHSVLVHPKTVFSLFTSDTTEGCAPLTVNFSDHSRGGSYMSWDFGDGNVSNGVKKPTHTYTKGGRYLVKQYVNNGCSYDTTESMINVFDKPNVKWTVASNTVCAKQIVSFINSSTNVSNYFWDFGDGSTSNLSSPSHVYRQPGRYKVTLSSQSNAYKCFSSYSDSVFILPLPDLNMKVDTWQGCQPFTIHISKAAKPNEFYNWDFGDGNTAVGASQMHTYKDTGDYTVILYARNTNGCYDTALQKVHVFPVSKSSFTMSISSACNGPADVQFTNTSTGAQGYLWLFGNGKSSTANNPSAHYDTTGDYLVQLVTYNRYNCTDTSKQHFIIYHTPVADFSVKPFSGCQPLSVQFANKSRYGTSYEWDFGDDATSTEASPAHIYHKAGNYTVSLKAANGQFCSDTVIKEKLITVYPIPVAGFTWNLHLAPFFDGSVAFTNTSSDGGLCFWDFGDGDTASGCDPVHRYKDFKQYRVMQVVRTPYGCADTTYRNIDVTIEKNLAVPNALMPEAGSEDVRIFKPSGRGLLTYHLQIFDRWGELLWETDSLDNGHPAIGWDGHYKGKLCEQDVYVWKIEATFLDGEIWEGKDYSGTKKKMGSVHLIR
jgi:PKD repeat protein